MTTQIRGAPRRGAPCIHGRTNTLAPHTCRCHALGTLRPSSRLRWTVLACLALLLPGCAAESGPADDEVAQAEEDATGKGELGVISDLDDTVIPKATPDLAKAPFPGVRALYGLLESRRGGKPGDVYYVTARTPERIADVPGYLEAHGVPKGVIETGTSTLPWLAQPEKVRDIEGILARTKKQRFVLFGDSSHKDPEVYKEILAKHPDRIVAAVIHKVNRTVSPGRVEGLHLVGSYAEAAAILYKRGAITKTEARTVMKSARDEGLALTDTEMTELLEP